MSEKPKSGGAAPYGFRRTNDGFEHDPQEAPIRKLIFKLFLKHKRKLTVANILNQKGYRTRSGAKFSDSSINRFLRDPLAKGHHKKNYLTAHGPKKFRDLKPESQWRYQPITPLIDEATWNKVNNLLIAQKQKPQSKKPFGLFTGLIQCDCGAQMHHPHGRKKYFCSKCDNNIEVEIIDKIYQSKLSVFRANNNTIQKLLSTKKHNNGSTLTDIWSTLSHNSKRHLIESLTSQIRVGPNHIKITFAQIPSL